MFQGLKVVSGIAGIIGLERGLRKSQRSFKKSQRVQGNAKGAALNRFKRSQSVPESLKDVSGVLRGHSGDPRKIHGVPGSLWVNLWGFMDVPGVSTMLQGYHEHLRGARGVSVWSSRFPRVASRAY